ncbi:MAG TPA: DUF4031 domain-containing protein [Thermoleophilaceae bacterium]|nr:DUF4031 domain-containing protein [Thermoleophilaceae bacterium]
MAVYVDEPIWTIKNRAHSAEPSACGLVERRWCHLTADTTAELHEFAARLGLVRQWFQSKPGRPWHDHYDLPEHVRAQAIAFGAQVLTTREMGRRQAAKRRSARSLRRLER